MTNALRVIQEHDAPAQATPRHTTLTASLSDDYGGRWDSRAALSILKRDGLADEVPILAVRFRADCQPMEPERRRRRLILLGTAMAPNRSTEEAAAWLDHMMRGLQEFPEDFLLEAIDAHVKSSRFLPTVADMVELAQAGLDKRQRDAVRLETIARLIASGADVPAALHPTPLEPEKPFDPATRCTPAEARAILAEMGLRSGFTDKLVGNLSAEEDGNG